MQQGQYAHRVYAKAPGAKRGTAVFDFVIGGFMAGIPCFVPLRQTEAFCRLAANYPVGTLFKIKEVRVA